jgi:hypothetical protein
LGTNSSEDPKLLVGQEIMNDLDMPETFTNSNQNNLCDQTVQQSTLETSKNEFKRRTESSDESTVLDILLNPPPATKSTDMLQNTEEMTKVFEHNFDNLLSNEKKLYGHTDSNVTENINEIESSLYGEEIKNHSIMTNNILKDTISTNPNNKVISGNVVTKLGPNSDCEALLLQSNECINPDHLTTYMQKKGINGCKKENSTLLQSSAATNHELLRNNDSKPNTGNERILDIFPKNQKNKQHNDMVINANSGKPPLGLEKSIRKRTQFVSQKMHNFSFISNEEENELFKVCHISKASIPRDPFLGSNVGLVNQKDATVKLKKGKTKKSFFKRFFMFLLCASVVD